MTNVYIATEELCNKLDFLNNLLYEEGIEVVEKELSEICWAGKCNCPHTERKNHAIGWCIFCFIKWLES